MNYTVLDLETKTRLLEKLAELQSMVKQNSARPGPARRATTLLNEVRELIDKRDGCKTFAFMHVLEGDNTVVDQFNEMAIGDYALIAVERPKPNQLH